jgi:hypothetical protein
MTDLQMSLFAIGAAIVVGVIGYNKWHEYRARRHVERAFSSEQDDVLMKPSMGAHIVERHEPVFAEQDFVSVLDEVLTNSAASASGLVKSISSDSGVELPVDKLIDCAIPLALDAPVRGEKVLPLLQALRHVGSKPVHFMGLTQAVEPSMEQNWQPIVHGGIYTELQAGVQLANRSGALNELEYSEMIVRLRQISDDIGAEPDIPDMSKVMNSARAVYQFVAQHDARLGINIRSNGAPWATSTLIAALERHGFDVRPDGRFVMQDSAGGALFSLTTNETVAAEHTSRLTLLLDVPRVAPQQEGFAAMVACAKSLVKRLDGTVVDDSNQILSDAAIEEISGQVNAFYGEMQVSGIPAGSHRALRLFI